MTCGGMNAGHVAACQCARRMRGNVRPRSRAGFPPSWGGGGERMVVSGPSMIQIARGRTRLFAWRQLIVGLGPGGWRSGGALNGAAAAAAAAEGH
jgi:hypothetical protein